MTAKKKAVSWEAVLSPNETNDHDGTWYYCSKCHKYHDPKSMGPFDSVQDGAAYEAALAKQKGNSKPKPVVFTTDKLPDEPPSPPAYRKPEWQTSVYGLADNIELTREAADFYVRLDLALDPSYPYAKVMMDQVQDQARALAWQFDRYLELACIGEARWYFSRAAPLKRTSKGLSRFLRAFHRIAGGSLKNPRQREKVWTNADTLLKKFGRRQVILYLVWLFDRAVWKELGFGGHRWAICASLLLEYRRGRLPDLLFVDQAFGLEHNGSIVYNKVGWSFNVLRQVLNYNQMGRIDKVAAYAYLGAIWQDWAARRQQGRKV